MLTKNKNPKVNYISRLLVLPLAAIVFFAFTLKVKNKNANLYDGKTITVIIDAGHGGEDNGAVSPSGVKEKDITLSIAKKIASLNSNEHMKIVLSRDDDKTIPVKERVVFAKNNNADIFISIHVNSSTDQQLNGFSVLVDKNVSGKNLELGSALINQLKETYKTANKIGVRTNNVLVLDKNICPSALVECGFLSNHKDAAFISNSADQEKIAKNILDAINVYASSEENGENKSSELINNNSSNTSVPKDSIPSMYYKDKKVKGFTFNDSKNEVYVKYSDGSKETITEEEALKRGIVLPPPSNALIFVNGKKSSKEEMKNIPSKDIQSINVLKDKKATEKYGEKGKNGVIEIITKPNPGNVTFVPTDAKMVEGIPSGAIIMIDGKESSENEFKNVSPANIKSIKVLKDQVAINKYGSKAKTGVVEITTKNNIPENTLIIIDGKESSKQDLNKIPGSGIKTINVLKSDAAIEKYGDKAKYGSVEIITKKNSIIFSAKDTMPDKVFTKVEVEASFPGGQQAWIKYISRVISESISKFTNADYGTCVIRFIVNTDGRVNDVIATTMKETNLAKVSLNAIKNGPKWIPASQNGHTVAAYRLQPVTLTNADKKVPSNNAKENKQTSQVNTGNDDKKVFVKLDQSASFPGGQSAWLKYISRAIQKSGNELIADKNSQGTCKVRFIVARDGKVSGVKAVTKQGSKLADVAVNAIMNGPRWIPGKQNGNVVNSYLIQPVTFALNDEVLPKGSKLFVVPIDKSK